jgi:RNA polymerase sigma-70 factor (ECF subfamily)
VCPSSKEELAMASKSTLPISDMQTERRSICPEFLKECYAAHYRYVFQICRQYFRQREDAEDAAAEVFVKLYRVLNQRDETLPFRPWLSQVAGHHCIDKLRQRKSEKSSSLESHDLSGFADHLSPSPLCQLLRKEEQRRIREQLILLPAKYKVPLVMRYYKRMSYSQIACTLNRGLPAVRMTIFRAKEQLRRNLYAVPV